MSIRQDGTHAGADFVLPVYRGEFIAFWPLRHTGKTAVYGVAGADDSKIGEVRWFPSWRCYALYPAPDTVYERKCLRDIADFCEILTTEHKAKKP